MSTKAWYDQYQLACEFHTLNGATTSGHFYQYAPGVQVSDDKAYDFGQIANPASSGCSGVGNAAVGPVPAAPSSPTPLRETTRTFQTFKNFLGTTFSSSLSEIPYGSGTKASETDYGHDGGTLVKASAVAHDEANFPAGVVANRGNVTSITRQCVSGCSGSVNTTEVYDETGQVISTTDACGNATCGGMSGTNHTTTYMYSDPSSGGNPAGNSKAYLTGISDPLGHKQSFSYNYANSELVSATDQNNNTTNYTYADSLGRLTETQGPPDSNNGGQRPTTTISYNDAAPSPSATTSVLMSGNTWKTSVAVRDGMGHVVQAQVTSDPSGTDYVDTVYNGVGLVNSVSNPHRSGSTNTDGTT